MRKELHEESKQRRLTIERKQYKSKHHQAMVNGKNKSIMQNGNIEQRHGCAGRLPYMGGAFRKMKPDGAYLALSDGLYQENPFTGAMHRMGVR